MPYFLKLPFHLMFDGMKILIGDHLSTGSFRPKLQDKINVPSVNSTLLTTGRIIMFLFIHFFPFVNSGFIVEELI